jgi:hypothetical protein
MGYSAPATPGAVTVKLTTMLDVTVPFVAVIVTG